MEHLGPWGTLSQDPFWVNDHFQTSPKMIQTEKITKQIKTFALLNQLSKLAKLRLTHHSPSPRIKVAERT